MSLPRRGEIWWGQSPDAKSRPYLVLTRDEAIPVLRTILVAPVSRTVRGIPSEVLLGPDEGLAVECAASCDGILPFPRAMLVRRVGRLGPERISELCGAARAAIDC